MTQREAAEKLGLTPAQYNDYEHGRRNVGYKLAKRFQEIAKVPWEVWS